MSILVNKPQNTNPLQPTKFSITFPGVTDTVYFCQQINLPGASVKEVVQPTPNIDLFKPGTRISYENLEMTFLVNEELTAWTEIYNWLQDNGTGNYRKSGAQAILTIYSNLNNPKIRVKYINVFPTSLTGLDFDTQLSADKHLSATATFRFDQFEIENLN